MEFFLVIIVKGNYSRQTFVMFYFCLIINHGEIVGRKLFLKISEMKNRKQFLRQYVKNAEK